jgi:hypothetical protein
MAIVCQQINAEVKAQLQAVSIWYGLRQNAALQQYPCTIFVTAYEYFIKAIASPFYWHLVYNTLPSLGS